MQNQIPSFNRDNEPQYDLHGDEPHFGGGNDHDDFPPIGEKRRSKGGSSQRALLGVLVLLLAGGAGAYMMLMPSDDVFVPATPYQPTPMPVPPAAPDASLPQPMANTAIPEIDPMTGLPLPPLPPELNASGMPLDPLAQPAVTGTDLELPSVPTASSPEQPNLEISQVDDMGETVIAPVTDFDPLAAPTENTALLQELPSEAVPAAPNQTALVDPEVAIAAAEVAEEPAQAEVQPPPPAPKNVGTGADGYYDTKDIVSSLADINRNRNIGRAPTQGAAGYVEVQKSGDGSQYDTLVLSAQRALTLSRYDSALELFNQAYDINSNDVRVLLGRGIAYQRTGQIDTAINAYEQALRVSPNNKEAMINMLGLLRGQDSAFVAQKLMALQSLYPANAGVAAQLSIISAEQGDYPSAVRYINSAMSIEPQNPMHPYNRAILAERMGQRDPAIDFYEKALEVDAVYGNASRLPRELIYDRLVVLRSRPAQ